MLWMSECELNIIYDWVQGQCHAQLRDFQILIEVATYKIWHFKRFFFNQKTLVVYHDNKNTLKCTFFYIVVGLSLFIPTYM